MLDLRKHVRQCALEQHAVSLFHLYFSVFRNQRSICQAKHPYLSCGRPWNRRSGLLRQWHDQNTEHWSAGWRRSSIATWCHAGLYLHTKQGCISHRKVSHPIRTGFRQRTNKSVHFYSRIWRSASKWDHICRSCICCWLQNRLVMKKTLIFLSIIATDAVITDLN